MLFLSAAAHAGETGLKEVYTIQLTDLNGNSTWLPYIGEYPVIIIYEDFRNIGDNRDIYLKTLGQQPLQDKIKLVYISNTAPAWHMPDFLINLVLRDKEKQYARVTFLIDRNRELQKKWRLLNSDEKSVIILVSRDAEIIDLSYEDPDRSDIKKIMNRLKKMIDL